jgi:hypothetical protein
MASGSKAIKVKQAPSPAISALHQNMEGVHLEALSLFAVVAPADIEARIRDEPTGQYARRTGFLYEWLTGKHIDVPDTTRGNYIPALDPELELTAPAPVNNPRWRVSGSTADESCKSRPVRFSASLQQDRH